MAMEVALHLKEMPTALGFFSGSLMCRQRWRRRLEDKAVNGIVCLRSVRNE